MKPDSGLKKFLRLGLIGAGALTVVSAIVNLASAWVLIEAAEEQALGITRTEFLVTYGAILLAGVALVVVGLRWKK